MKVSDVIAGQKLITARLDADVGHVAELMRAHHVHGVPIVDEWGALAGLVSATQILDLARAWSGSADVPGDGSWSPAQRAVGPAFPWQKLLAKDIMTSDLVTVTHDEDLVDAARALVNRNVHRAIVLGADRNVKGVISSLDFATLVAEGKFKQV